MRLLTVPRRFVIIAAGEAPSGVAARRLAAEIAEGAMVVSCDRPIPGASFVVGDGDGLSEQEKSALGERLVVVREQNTNDLCKAYRFILSEFGRDGSGIAITILGATGLREDHAIGNIFHLAEFETESVHVEMVTNSGTFSVVRERGSFAAVRGDAFSVFAPFPDTHARSDGLEWPLDGVDLYPPWKGTLNRACAEEVWIETTRPLVVYRPHPPARTPEGIFSRVELMLGEDAMQGLAKARVAVFGLGGVGSWCAEALARTGVGHLMLVDSDDVEASNVNRQLMATTATVGRAKTEALAERLRAINPSIGLELRNEPYCAETAASFGIESYDYVIDAIDSLENKALLIRHALSIPSVTLFSSMGAALKLDPLQVRKSWFTKVEGDGLARALRQKFRKTGGIPKRKFMCVWSPERGENRGASVDPKSATDTWGVRKARINGAVAHTTGAFGLALAGLVVADIGLLTSSPGAKRLS